MNSERNIVKKLFENKKQELEEASFEANGNIYKCAFGHYTCNGEPITREDYFKAKEGNGGAPTSVSGAEDSIPNGVTDYGWDSGSRYLAVNGTGIVGEIHDLRDEGRGFKVLIDKDHLSIPFEEEGYETPEEAQSALMSQLKDYIPKSSGNDSKKSSALPPESSSYKDIMKSVLGGPTDIEEDYKDNFSKSASLLGKSVDDVRVTHEEDMSYEEFSGFINDVQEGNWTKGETIPYGGDFYSYQSYTHNDTGDSVVICTNRDGYQMIYH